MNSKLKAAIYYLLLLGLVVALSSCAKDTVIIEPTPEKIMPPKPSPITTYSIDWKVTDANVCLSVEHGLLLNVQTKDTLRYIKELKVRLCYHGDKQYCEVIND